MELGLFLMPAHPPGRDIRAAVDFDLRVIRHADELGFAEAWIGEHYTSAWEPIPSPDLVIAQSLRETSQIKLGPGVHVLPYHHPVELAHRAAFLDHLAGGRYLFGVGAGTLLMDKKAFGTFEPDKDPLAPALNHKMEQEALDIILRIWTADGPFEYRGDYWSFEWPAFDEHEKGPHMRPFQTPHPPIAMAGGSPNSPTLRMAGERGFIPMSLNLGNAEYLSDLWTVYADAALGAGREPDRRNWRVVREFLVAETDDEAIRLATTGAMGHIVGDYLLPLYKRLGVGRFLINDPDMTDDDITLDYMARNMWLVGSPETVAARLADQYRRAGGWGVLLGPVYDFVEDPDPWLRSMKLMAEEVLPLFERELAAEPV